ncbi:MAG: hypothetical protein WBA36_03730 [Mesorhizobium sp.]
MTMPATHGGFGTPNGIDPLRLHALPPSDQRPGALMLLDMGLSERSASRHLGLSVTDFNRLSHGAQPLVRRRLESDLAGDYA